MRFASLLRFEKKSSSSLVMENNDGGTEQLRFEMIATMESVTTAPADVCRFFLETMNWDLNSALDMYWRSDHRIFS